MCPTHRAPARQNTCDDGSERRHGTLAAQRVGYRGCRRPSWSEPWRCGCRNGEMTKGSSGWCTVVSQSNGLGGDETEDRRRQTWRQETGCQRHWQDSRSRGTVSRDARSPNPRFGYSRWRTPARTDPPRSHTLSSLRPPWHVPSLYHPSWRRYHFTRTCVSDPKMASISVAAVQRPLHGVQRAPSRVTSSSVRRTIRQIPWSRISLCAGECRDGRV